MNAVDILFFVAGMIAVFAGLISVLTPEPSKAMKVTDPMFWFSITFVVLGFIALFAADMRHG